MANALIEHGHWKTGNAVAVDDLVAAILAYHSGTPIRITTTGSDTLHVTQVDYDGTNIVLHVA